MFLPANIMNIIHINITSTLHFFKKRKTFLKKHGYKHLQLKTKRHEPPKIENLFIRASCHSNSNIILQTDDYNQSSISLR